MTNIKIETNVSDVSLRVTFFVTLNASSMSPSDVELYKSAK
jgi:hypothetical protein